MRDENRDPKLPAGKEHRESVGFYNPPGDNLCYRNVALLALLHLPAFREWAIGQDTAQTAHNGCGPRGTCVICNMRSVRKSYWEGDREQTFQMNIGTEIKIDGTQEAEMATFWWHLVSTGYWTATRGEQEDTFEFLESLIQLMTDFTMSNNPLGLFQSTVRPRGYGRCEKCGHEQAGENFESSILRLNLPPRGEEGYEAKMTKFQKIIDHNWSMINDPVTCKKCGCHAVLFDTKRLTHAPTVLACQLNVLRETGEKITRLVMIQDEFEIAASAQPEDRPPIKYNVKVVIFHRGAGSSAGHFTVAVRMKTPTRLKEQRIPNEAKWAFLNDDEPPKTYARLWDIMVTEQGFLPHQFQVYGVIAQRADTEDPGVGGIEVKEPPLIATERQARFPPLKSSLDLDLEVRAKHKDLGYLTGTARIQLKRSGKPPKSPRDSRRSLKRKIEELVEENRRLKRRLEESDSTGKNGPLTAVGNTADAGAKIGEKTRPAENSTGDDEDQVVDLTGDDEALAENSTADDEDQAQAQAGKARPAENSTADDEDQAQAQAGKARPAENSTGLDEDRAKARAREAREQMVKMFAEVVRAAQTTAGVPAKWPLERLEKAWRCLDDRKPPPEYAQEFYDWFNPTGAWMRFQEIASETIEQLAATTAGMAPDAQAAQEEATRRDIEAVLAQMEAEWSALQLKEFWQGLQQVLQWMPLNPAEQAYYDRFKGLCTPREPFDLTTTPLTNLQSPPATTPKAQPAEEVELWGNVEAFTSRFNAERTEGEPNADDLTGDEWLEFVNLPSSSQPNNGSSPEVNCPPAPDLGIDPADIDKLATHDNGGADQ